MATPMKSWDPEREKLSEWIVSAEEAAAETSAQIVAAIERMQALSAGQLAAVESAITKTQGEMAALAKQPKGNSGLLLLELRSAVTEAMQSLRRDTADQASALKAMMQQNFAALSAMRKAVEQASAKQPVHVEFEVTARDAKNRVKTFKAIENPDANRAVH